MPRSTLFRPSIASLLLFLPFKPPPPLHPLSTPTIFSSVCSRTTGFIQKLMSRNSAQASSTAPLGSAGTTPRPANALPPRVQTSPIPQLSTLLNIPEVSLPAPAATTVPLEGISHPAANTAENLIDHGLIDRLLAPAKHDYGANDLRAKHPAPSTPQECCDCSGTPSPVCTDPTPNPFGCTCPLHRPQCPTPHRHTNHQPPEESTSGQPSTSAREPPGDSQRTVSQKVHTYLPLTTILIEFKSILHT